MNRLILALAAALALSGCAVAPATVASAGATVADSVGVPPPATAADRTVLDEKAMTGVELAYKAARIAVETGVDAGLIKGAAAARFAALDSQAYRALGAVRAAYRAGNAASYRAALTEAQAAIGAVLALTGKTGD